MMRKSLKTLIRATLSHEHDDAAGDARIDEQLHFRPLGHPLERGEP